ncbi:MAG: PKD-like family lipoprotein [Bacteroidales bacterium]|nr:PKD-like family lipoprotein [Bacteroidales bacterium]MDD4109128.1 PKD-like family lipoprotein [Prolixibacteraceae bacterium]
MKKYFLMLAVVLLAGCYVDKGNYDYKEINEIVIDVSDIPTEYNISQFDELTIDPEVTFTKNTIPEEDLEYKWTIFNTHYANSYSEVIGNERVFSGPITQQSSSSSYILMLDVKDKVTGVAAQQRFTLWISSNIISGWLVVHTANNQSDLDYIATTNAVPTISENRRFSNVYSLVNGSKIEGTATFVAGARKNNTVVNSIYIGTENELYKIKGKTFEFEYLSQSMFTIVPTVIKPQCYEIGGTYSNYQFLINNNQLHSIANQSAWEVTFSYALLPNAGTLGTSAVELAPFIYMPEDFPSTTRFGGVFYDKLGQRFVILPYATMPVTTLSKFTDQVGAAFNVNNIGKELIYMERGYNNYCYSVFKDNSGNGRWLYVSDFNKAMSSNMAVAAYDMSALTNIANAKFFSTGNRGQVLLYATTRDIYTYEYAGSNTAVKINNDFPAGEEITSMKIYKPGTTNGLGEANGAILYVATWNGTEGKLYEFSMNEANGYLRNKTPLNIFTGFGKIMDMNHKLEGTGTGS